MSLAEHTSLVQTLLLHPHDPQVLFTAYETLRAEPKAYVALLVTAAEMTDQPVAASHWLTEAARVEVHSLNDERGGVRLLEAALDRDALNLRAIDQLSELCRGKAPEPWLEERVRARASALEELFRRDSALPRAPLAFEKLSGLYEAIGDPAAALAALRTALELERTRGRYTTPSPPPDVPPESSFRSLSGDPPKSELTPPPGAPWTVNPSSDARDTLPIPTGDKSAPRSARVSPSNPSTIPPAPESHHGDPLLSIIEALHALRRCEDVVDGAALVLNTALAAIPSSAGFVHVVDVGSRDFVIVAASGDHSADVIGSRAAEADPVLLRAQRALLAVTLDASGGGWFLGARYRVLHPKKGVLCAPVHFDGKLLGAIELVDPSRPGTSAFTDADRHAMTYVGERLGEFLADRTLTF